MKNTKVLKSIAAQPKPEYKTITCRFTEAELDLVKKKAAKWATGNMTALIRHAVLNFEPSADDLA